MQQVRAALNKMLVLPQEEWDAFSSELFLRAFRKGDHLIREGQTEQYIYFLNSGATRHFFTRDGKEFTVDFQFAGEFVTAYYSFITREPSAISIVAMQDTAVLAITHERLQKFYDQYKNGERIGRLIAEHQYVKRLRREIDLLSLTAEERYQQLIAKNPELVRQISVKHLSSYLGIQPESLSRIRKLYAQS